MAKTYDQHLHDSLAYLGLPALASHSAWTPNTDVYETPEGLVVKMEIAYGPFERRIVIPRSVDGSRVRAQFQNGFLQIELPKSQKSEHTTFTVIIEQLG